MGTRREILQLFVLRFRLEAIKMLERKKKKVSALQLPGEDRKIVKRELRHSEPAWRTIDRVTEILFIFLSRIPRRNFSDLSSGLFS